MKMILLSFDIEEFDLPEEYGKPLPFEEQIRISSEGTVRILDLLRKHAVKATFFVTAQFAKHAETLVKQIVAEGHEIASHGFYHDRFSPEHLKQSKEILEEMGNVAVKGYRMARMMPVSETEIYKAGYRYNSSVNPIFLPGRYNNLKEPRSCFKRDNVWQLPVSVTPLLRFPLFWLSFHNLPLFLYRWLVSLTVKKDGYLNVYFHPWEFMPIAPKSKYNIPFYITHNANTQMFNRLDRFIRWCKNKKYAFERTDKLIEIIEREAV